jgi:hypothetical protein
MDYSSPQSTNGLTNAPIALDPAKMKSKTINPSEPEFMIAMDGNFQQHHYAYASKDEPREDQYPSMFIPPSKIAVDMQAISPSEHQAVGINVSNVVFPQAIQCHS